MDVLLGRALVFELRFVTDLLGLRVWPLDIVLHPELRLLHDLTLARAGGGTSVNCDTGFDSASYFKLSHVLRHGLFHFLF